MKNWPQAVHDGMLGGALAAAATVGVLALCGRRESRSAAAPLNAVSHVYWGERALRENRVSLRYTGAGLVTHVLSALMWGIVYEKLLGERSVRSLPRLARDTAAATAAIAAVDFQVVPERLTPGFEHRLSTASLFGVYTALGFALAAATRWSSSRHAHRSRTRSRSAAVSTPPSAARSDR